MHLHNKLGLILHAMHTAYPDTNVAASSRPMANFHVGMQGCHDETGYSQSIDKPNKLDTLVANCVTAPYHNHRKYALHGPIPNIAQQLVPSVTAPDRKKYKAVTLSRHNSPAE